MKKLHIGLILIVLVITLSTAIFVGCKQAIDPKGELKNEVAEILAKSSNAKRVEVSQSFGLDSKDSLVLDTKSTYEINNQTVNFQKQKYQLNADIWGDLQQVETQSGSLANKQELMHAILVDFDLNQLTNLSDIVKASQDNNEVYTFSNVGQFELNNVQVTNVTFNIQTSSKQTTVTVDGQTADNQKLYFEVKIEIFN